MNIRAEDISLEVDEISSAMFGALEPCDSGFDSDDEAIARRRLAADEQAEKQEMDVLIEWQKSPEPGDSEGSGDRSSPNLCVFELSPSDEDDDGSVLELVIPMQKYQRVPTSPMKLPHKVPSFLTNLFCCARK